MFLSLSLFSIKLSTLDYFVFQKVQKYHQNYVCILLDFIYLILPVNFNIVLFFGALFLYIFWSSVIITFQNLPAILGCLFNLFIGFIKNFTLLHPLPLQSNKLTNIPFWYETKICQLFSLAANAFLTWNMKWELRKGKSKISGSGSFLSDFFDYWDT